MAIKKLSLNNVPVRPCPCGSGSSYPDCCGRFHDGAPAPSAERLMRARYSAYVLGDSDFVVATWHPSTRPPTLDQNSEDHGIAWLGLEIKHQAETGDDASVEFVARYKQGGRATRMHEISRFVREAGSWWYVDGSFPKAEKQ